MPVKLICEECGRRFSVGEEDGVTAKDVVIGEFPVRVGIRAD